MSVPHVRVYHEGLDAYADVPETALAQMARQGWLKAPEESPIEEIPEPEPAPKTTSKSRASTKES